MLVISAYQGQAIRVGDRRVTVGELIAPGLIYLQVDGESEAMLVGWDRRVEIFPEVYVEAERSLGMGRRHKFLFTAPPHVGIRVDDDAPRYQGQPRGG